MRRCFEPEAVSTSVCLFFTRPRSPCLSQPRLKSALSLPVLLDRETSLFLEEVSQRELLRPLQTISDMLFIGQGLDIVLSNTLRASSVSFSSQFPIGWCRPIFAQ